MNNNIQKDYKIRQHEYAERSDLQRKKHSWFAYLRVLVFLLMIVLIWLTLRPGYTDLIILEIIFFFIIFGMMVNKHDNIAWKRDHYDQIARINEDEIRRMKGDFNHLDNGSEFVNEDHDYTYDLDIFGNYSLFQLLNHTTTIFGKKLLADWLNKKGPLEQIKKRQFAVKSLIPKLDWRQAYQAAGTNSKPDEEVFGRFIIWLNSENKLLKTPFLKVILWFMIIVVCVLIFLIVNDWIDWQWLLIPDPNKWALHHEFC